MAHGSVPDISAERLSGSLTVYSAMCVNGRLMLPARHGQSCDQMKEASFHIQTDQTNQTNMRTTLNKSGIYRQPSLSKSFISTLRHLRWNTVQIV